MLREQGHARPDGRMLNPDSLCASVFDYKKAQEKKSAQVSAPVKETQKTKKSTGTDLMLAKLALRSHKLTDAQKVEIASRLLA